MLCDNDIFSQQRGYCLWLRGVELLLEEIKMLIAIVFHNDGFRNLKLVVIMVLQL